MIQSYATFYDYLESIYSLGLFHKCHKWQILLQFHGIFCVLTSCPFLTTLLHRHHKWISEDPSESNKKLCTGSMWYFLNFLLTAIRRLFPFLSFYIFQLKHNCAFIAIYCLKLLNRKIHIIVNNHVTIWLHAITQGLLLGAFGGSNNLTLSGVSRAVVE